MKRAQLLNFGYHRPECENNKNFISTCTPTVLAAAVGVQVAPAVLVEVQVALAVVGVPVALAVVLEVLVTSAGDAGLFVRAELAKAETGPHIAMSGA